MPSNVNYLTIIFTNFGLMVEVDLINSIDLINIIANEFIETITHILPVSKRKATINRI